MTVRQKIFLYMGLLVLIVSISHAIPTQVYTGYLFDRFQREELDPGYLNASPQEQLEMVKTYVLDNSRPIGIIKLCFFVVVGLLFSFWMSGVLTLPLRKLLTAIERVAQGDRDVKVEVPANDEYGKVTRTFNEMTERLREAEEARRRLVADVAHELRTPLSIMQLKLENMQQTGLSVPPEMLLRLHDEVLRLSLLVDDLHVLSLAESGRLALDRQPLDLAERLEQLVEDVKPEAEEHGLTVRFRTSAQPVTVMADTRRITQVFINLLTNAIRYTPSGGTIIVDIADRIVEPDRDYACVSVIDSGIGIPAEELAHLFDRFYRVEEARSRYSGGTGLGLSIADQFVKAHGGRIRVDSRAESGTTFAVYLPKNQGYTEI
ncbi:MAG: HAMP domain-containing histidine kinase [Paenibacillaceae bacterium]|nr:HAMP domain-containing histidine kinase [Paenibacillaceae bacterium]